MNKKKVIDHIVHWIKTYVESESSNIKSLIIGVSGGIDSALTSTLCAMTNIKTILVKIPLNSNNMSLSRVHCKALQEKYNNVEVYEIDLSSTFQQFKIACMENKYDDQLGFANSKSRLRMTLLYQIAQSSSGIVIGTGNKVEDFGVGFFTKYGDGGVDISPIADLNKSEVRELARELQINNSIITADPTDGLWDDGRTDEDQLGLTYEQLEDAMTNVNSDYRKKYMDIRKNNLHKMKPIPVCNINDKIKNN
jgi:NAD+ synthase